ncbi:MAG: helix-hairpin-helix domain-containing protein [Gemmatimonadales bacterium]|nr:helix-hairpin-helix domain-containing protein [Gemmatimonadales bacterium]
MLGGLALAGHLVLAAFVTPGAPPGGVQLFDLATDGDPIAHRELSVARARPLGADERIDVDRAGAEDLTRLPGIGPALARRIVADREARGAFGTPAGLDRVAGVGPAILARLAPHLRFSAPPAEASTTSGGPLLDVNRVGAPELDALPGIGAVRAAAIVAFRDSVGPFRGVGDLRRVPGLPAALVARIAPRLSFH